MTVTERVNLRVKSGKMGSGKVGSGKMGGNLSSRRIICETPPPSTEEKEKAFA